MDLERPDLEEAVGSADPVFGMDGAGSGVRRRFLSGAEARVGKAEFRADGSIYFDGIRVVNGR